MKRQVLEHLKRDELVAAVERLELPVADRRVRGLLIEALAAAPAPLTEILADLKRDRLKELCRALDLDDGGREKAAIVERLTDGRSRPPEAGARPAPFPRESRVDPAARWPESAPAPQRPARPAPAPARTWPDRAPPADRRRNVGSPAPGRAESWTPAGPDRASPRERRRRAPGPPRKKQMNIQDGFLFESLKEGRLLHFTLVTGQDLEGRIVRFDQYAILVATGTREILVYKHVISDVAAV